MTISAVTAKAECRLRPTVANKRQAAPWTSLARNTGHDSSLCDMVPASGGFVSHHDSKKLLGVIRLLLGLVRRTPDRLRIRQAKHHCAEARRIAAERGWTVKADGDL
jgi:hypothetical protein